MKFFQPDNFSSAAIKFAKLNKNNRFSFCGILDLYFKRYSILSIEQLVGTEINSNNYKVRILVGGRQKTFLLRKFLFLQGKKNIDFYLHLMMLFKKRGIMVSEPVKSLNDHLSVKSENNYYAFFSFIKGTHFLPSRDGYLAVAKEVGNLHKVLGSLDQKYISKIKKMSQSNVNIYYNRIKTYDIKDLERIEKKIKKIKYQSAVIKTVKQELPFLKNTIQEISKYSSQIKKLPKSIIHSDLHPHNLLMYNQQVSAILDFDSIRESERARDVAAAIYRLGRQFLINTHYTEEKINKKAVRLKDLFLKEYCTINPLSKEEIKLMPIILKDEFMRKILVVLKGVFEENYFAWEKDIIKFIMALKEIKYFWN